MKDITKIEKRLSQVLERIPKGALLETHFPLDEGNSCLTEDSSNCFALDKQEGEDDGDNRESVDAAMPIGSKIGESSSRLLSARKGLLRRRHKVDD